jgi:hypothetical protein
MGSKGSSDALTQQLDEVRDRAADLLASDGASRDRSRWPGRMLWLGLGVGIGAAAAGGRLLKMLPAQLASRLDSLVGKVTSPVDEVIDVTERGADAVTGAGGQG